jgi:hypothetical protein
LSGGTGQISLTGLSNDQHYIGAVYTPDSGSFTSSSALQRFSVLRAETATGVVLDSSYVPVGQEVTVTATVGVFPPGDGTPGGTIQFSDEYGTLGDPVPVGPDGTAQIALQEDVGDHVVYASYSGDEWFMPSSGQADLGVYDPNAPPPTTDKLATTVSVVSSKNPINPGETYTVTATVAPVSASDALLDGTVAFSIGTAGYGDPIPLDANHSASTTITPPRGTTRQTVRAHYSGNASFLDSNGFLSERIVPPLTAAVGPTTPPPPDTVPPIFTVKLTAARLKQALRHGLRVHVDCNENCSADLRLALPARRARALGMRVRGKSLVVAEGSYDFADRKSSDIVIRFTSRARKALGKVKRVQLRLTATAGDLSGNDAVQTQTVTLKR